jgi:hypothetical protein
MAIELPPRTSRRSTAVVAARASAAAEAKAAYAACAGDGWLGVRVR